MSAPVRTESTMSRLLVALVLALALPARAQVAAGVPLQSAPQNAATVAERIEQVRLKVQHMPAERRAAGARQLEALGPAALAPMKALLQKDSPALAAMRVQDPAAYTAFRTALAEAVGALRDPASAPLLRQLVDGTEDRRVVRAAAEGLGKLCRDEDVQFLSQRAQAGQPHEIEALEGFASCRREPAARVLVGRLAARPDEKTTVALAVTLGRVGSSWAWEAMGPSHATEGRQVRALVGRAIVDALPTATPAGFRALSDALLMVNDPQSSQQLAALPPSAALDELQKRLATSHAR